MFFIEFRKKKGENERGRGTHVREKHQLVAPILTPTLGQRSNPKPEYVPWMGIEPATFHVQDNTPSNWASQPRWPWWSLITFLQSGTIKCSCVIWYMSNLKPRITNSSSIWYLEMTITFLLWNLKIFYSSLLSILI